MACVALALEIGTYDDGFVRRLALKLDADLIDFRPLERRLAEIMCSVSDGLHQLVQSRRHPSAAPWRVRSSLLAEVIGDEIRAAAGRGDCVIVGWMPPIVLAGCPQVRRVCVWAPCEHRAREVMRRRGYQDEVLGHWDIETEEAMLGHAVSSLFSAEWRDRNRFDLVINSAGGEPDDGSDEIMALARPRLARAG